MSHARIEEISDSEPEYDSDPSEDDIEAFDEREIIKARGLKPSAVPNPNLIDPRNIPGGAGRGAGGGASPFTGVGGVSRDGVEFQSTNDEGKYKNFQCIYPVYFDKKRTRGEGRRVGVEGAGLSPRGVRVGRS
jgi:signal recognition particle subunit SRP19